MIRLKRSRDDYCRRYGEHAHAPYLAAKVRDGARLGHQGYDHMFLDGLEDAYDKGKLMGSFLKTVYIINSRARLRMTNMRSLRRAQEAQQAGIFAAEICPVT